MKPATWTGKLLGSGCDPCPVDGTTSTAAHERGDDALEQLGPGRASGGRYRLPARRCQGPARHLPSESIHRQSHREPLFAHGDRCRRGRLPGGLRLLVGRVQRQPFEVWMLDCVGAMGVKRLKPEYRHHIPGVIGYCRSKFEQQVPFDYEFRPDDAALYCVELTEKAFRSQGLVLSQPVRIGDWEHLGATLDRPRDPVCHSADAGATRSLWSSPFTCPATSARGCGPHPCWRPFLARNRRPANLRRTQISPASTCGEILI